MKELVLKKRNEMEELCRKAHIIPENYMVLDKTIASMESGRTGKTVFLLIVLLWTNLCLSYQ